MRNFQLSFIILLLFQNLYSQHSVLRYPFFFLPPKNQPISFKSANYDLKKEYFGSIVFDEVEYKGKVILRKDSAIVNDLKIYRFNKKLTKLSLQSGEETILIERIGEERFLHRVLLDSLDIKIYDKKLYQTLENEKLDVLTLKLRKDNKLINFPNSFLRSRKGKINVFLKRANLNKEQELFLRDWLESNI
jgi:hypothetical protein